MNNYVLSADIGTSSLKAAVLDIAANTTCDQLRLKSFAKIAYNDIILQGNILTSTGINAEHWEAAFLRAAETLRKFDPDVFSKINAICIWKKKIIIKTAFDGRTDGNFCSRKKLGNSLCHNMTHRMPQHLQLFAIFCFKT
ncbi:MAG: hypothetical protein Ta2F_05480 [Termitinemataceae bacterium]|nr:MAG: hypothetical protein Ta2F_05480 [Termitinemataceae bacterium]